MSEPLTPIADILRYATVKHGLEYAMALEVCIELTSLNATGADIQWYGDYAQWGMNKICAELLPKD
jgi:hypothetical protein